MFIWVQSPTPKKKKKTQRQQRWTTKRIDSLLYPIHRQLTKGERTTCTEKYMKGEDRASEKD
jgi:hypothetical protein